MRINKSSIALFKSAALVLLYTSVLNIQTKVDIKS